MTTIHDSLTKAIAEAREALAKYQDRDARHYLDEAMADLLAALDAAQPVASCEYCDNTGDVHSVTGEWRGTCTECTPAAEADAEVMLTAFDEACKNSEGRRVSWHGYTEGQRLDVIRRAMLAAANKENNP